MNEENEENEEDLSKFIYLQEDEIEIKEN